MKEFSYSNNNLYVNNEIIYSFKAGIKEIASFDDYAIVVLNKDDYLKEDTMRTRNVVCVNSLGKLLWQIPNLESVIENCSYVGIIKEKSVAKLVKFDGTFAIVEPRTGQVLKTPMESINGRKLW